MFALVDTLSTATAFSMTFFIIIFIIMMIFFLAIVLPIYILGSIGLMKIAKNKGVENAWLAWIPIGNLYVLGKVTDNFDIGSVNFNKLGILLPVSVLAPLVLFYIPIIGQLISLAIYVEIIFVYIKLYKMYSPQNYVVLTVISCFGLAGIIMFVLRNKIPVDVPAKGKPIF